VLWQHRNVVATSELSRVAGVASGAGFTTYIGFSFENTGMHHWREGTFHRLHTLRIYGRVFFSGWPFSRALRCGGVDFAWDVHNSGQ
jgi:hypothetical protein